MRGSRQDVWQGAEHPVQHRHTRARARRGGTGSEHHHPELQCWKPKKHNRIEDSPSYFRCTEGWRGGIRHRGFCLVVFLNRGGDRLLNWGIYRETLLHAHTNPLPGGELPTAAIQVSGTAPGRLAHYLGAHISPRCTP